MHLTYIYQSQISGCESLTVSTLITGSQFFNQSKIAMNVLYYSLFKNISIYILMKLSFSLIKVHIWTNTALLHVVIYWNKMLQLIEDFVDFKYKNLIKITAMSLNQQKFQ